MCLRAHSNPPAYVQIGISDFGPASGLSLQPWQRNQWKGLSANLKKLGQLSRGLKKALVKQAPALTLKQWALWLQWLCEHAGPRVYLAVFFTGAFGLRCSESLGLKRSDICLDAAIPKIKITGEASGARKSPGDVYVRTQHMKLMRRILKDWIRVQRFKKP